MKYNIALIGATGNVGKEVLTLLSKSKIPIKKIFAIASQNSISKKVRFGRNLLRVKTIDSLNFDIIDLVFFATNSIISKKYVEVIRKNVKLIIDLSSCYRMNKKVPLVIPEVNLDSLKLAKKSKIVSNPNCIAIPLAMILKPFHELASISRVVISTYQSVSGAGKKAMNSLYFQTKNKLFNFFLEGERKINMAFNIIPKINNFTKKGYTKEEIKIRDETNKILSANINITCTCVRVPVFIGHSISVNVEFLNNVSVNEAYCILNKSEGILTDQYTNYKYFTPIDCVGKDKVLVSRIRQDNVLDNVLNFWIVSDNIKKGAALNAIQIAEKYIKFY